LQPPQWLVPEPYTDTDLGVLKSGKEAQVGLVERVGAGRSCLLARKLYVPREVTKGVLESLGAQRATAFRHDVVYREGRQFRKTRDRRAVERMTTYGRRLLQERWTGHEFDVLTALWQAGARVPYPVSFDADVMLMEYVGSLDGAAPQLAQARLPRALLASAWEQLVENLHLVVGAGWAHGDLSAFNLLWWEERLWFIDLPQAVDLAANPQGLEFLHRDVLNVVRWFTRRGLERDPEMLFAELVATAFG
jgi:RIO kinase 1